MTSTLELQLYVTERREWILDKGSSDLVHALRNMEHLGIGVLSSYWDRKYREERRDLERPGWYWVHELARIDPIPGLDISSDGTGLLREIRKTDPTARRAVMSVGALNTMGVVIVVTWLNATLAKPAFRFMMTDRFQERDIP